MDFIYLIVILVVVGVLLAMAIINRYRRCPSDKILVVYGTTGGSSSAKCVHGGGKFVWPVVQDYAYLSLTPIGIDANLTNALSRQNIRVDVPCRFTVGISTEPDSMLAAAERLLGLQSSQIQEMARDILFGQLRLVIATMSIEELNSDRDKFLEAITANVEVELKKIGLRLINVNVTDIKDESGYIEALGQEAAAKAINEAKVRVAEQEKVGEIGKAEAVRETRIRTAEANAQAVQGENEAKIAIANSEANRREREAEAQRKAIAAEKVAQAQALEEAYAAEQKAEDARADRDRASQNANVIVAQEIEKRRLVIAAEAEAEQKRVNAKGEADAIYAKMEAEAKGLYEILTKQAEGYDRMIKAAGGDATKAYTLLLLEKLPE
ncbi:MAG: flotillin family protein, partial [Bacteroidaceae bacterium]|nr:flotillin family protein [Bacteroidaceae bacterium]